MQQVKVSVFSHTHWDREWYRTFQTFRFGLVSVIDQILNLLQARDYDYFILDGQTIVLEDYLEIRPELEKALAGWISKGKLLIGPWYVLPDEFLVSGESVIRNLIFGKKICKHFGKVQNIGYLPDMFGHISQMPQILKGFGIDKAVVWRGVNPSKSLFLWEGLDKTSIISLHLTEGYYNTFLINYEKQADDLLAHLQKLEDQCYKGMILFPNGGDHLAPVEELKSLLVELNTKYPKYKFVQSTIEEYFQQLKINKEELELIKGELRDPEKAYILPGVFSARMYLKQKNYYLQNLITNWVEPLATISWLFGNDYNQGFIDLAWKYLLQNQPHDSICGCSTDQVHKEMLQRYDSAEEICDALIKQAMESISSSIALETGFNYLIVYNMANYYFTTIDQFTVDFLKNENIENFKLEDLNGNNIDFEIIDKTYTKKFISEINVLPDWIDITRFVISLKIDGIVPFGYKVIKIIPTENNDYINQPSLLTGDTFLQNEYIRVEVKNNNLELQNMITGKSYLVNTFDSSGDGGDEYNYSPPKIDTFSSAILLESKIYSENALEATLKIEYELNLPEKIEENREYMSNSNVINKITSFVTLKEKDPLVYFKTIINNQAKDHRLRVNFSQNLNSNNESYCWYDTLFGLMRKEVKVNNREYDMAKYKERIEETFAIQNFADLSEQQSGITLITKGLPEIEITSKLNNISLSLTLLRCVGWLSRDDLRTRGGGAGPAFATPEAQCQGINSFEYSLYAHKNNFLKSDVIKKVFQVSSGIKYMQYKPENKTPLSLEGSLLRLEPENLVTSCLKRSESENGVIFRFFNPLPDKQTFIIYPADNFIFSAVFQVRLDEEKLNELERNENGTFSGIIEPSEIITLEFITINMN